MELSFHELVKMIHPDTNPNVKDSSIKMSLAVKYKSNPLALWNLSIKWGLNKGEYNITAPEAVVVNRNPQPRTTPQPSRGEYESWVNRFRNPRTGVWDVSDYPTRVTLTVFDRVNFIFNGLRYEGIIMDIRGRVFKVLTEDRICVVNRTTIYEAEDMRKLGKASRMMIALALKVFKNLSKSNKIWNV